MKTKHLGNISMLACAGCWLTTELMLTTGVLGGTWKIMANAFEAGTVGALADWFAVSALFREVPIPFVRRHTNIIAKNRHRIADGIVDMVQNRWLSPTIVREKLEKANMALMTIELFEREDRRLKEYVVSLLRKLLEGIDDAGIVLFLEVAIKNQLANIDLPQSLGRWMNKAIKSGYYYEVWDLLYDSLLKATQNADLRNYIATELREAAVKEKGKDAIKKVFIGLAEMADGFNYHSAAETLILQFRSILQEARNDRNHLIPQKLNRVIFDFAQGLEQGDPQTIATFNEFKNNIIREADLKQVIARMMTELKNTVSAQLDEEDSPFRSVIHGYVDLLIASLKSEPQLQEKIDWAIKEAIITFVEKNHSVIGDMVRTSLDPGRLSNEQMVLEIEEKVGDDLQYIRLNGATVGCFVGLLIGVVKLALS